MGSRENRDYITPILNEVKMLPDSRNLKIIHSRISDCLVLFSLYGKHVDNFLNRFLEFRAHNQRRTADKLVRRVFKAIFTPSSRPLFNLYLTLDKKADWDQFKKDYPNIDTKRLDAKNPDGTFKYYKAEVDAAIQVSLFPSLSGGGNTPKERTVQENISKNIHRGYIFTEMKMFTAPHSDPGRSLRNLLQKARLEDYFSLRYIYGVIGISYLKTNKDNAPVAQNDSILQGRKNTPTNIIHVAMMDNRILKMYSNAPKRASIILEAISKAQKVVEKECGYQEKDFKFELIYNILKVIKMSQKIVSLEKRIEKLERERQKKEREKKKIEQEKQQVEQEKQQVEQEKQEIIKQTELYRKKLKSLGIDPDTLE